MDSFVTLLGSLVPGARCCCQSRYDPQRERGSARSKAKPWLGFCLWGRSGAWRHRRHEFRPAGKRCHRLRLATACLSHRRPNSRGTALPLRLLSGLEPLGLPPSQEFSTQKVVGAAIHRSPRNVHLGLIGDGYQLHHHSAIHFLESAHRYCQPTPHRENLHTYRLLVDRPRPGMASSCHRSTATQFLRYFWAHSGTHQPLDERCLDHCLSCFRNHHCVDDPVTSSRP